MRLIENRSSIFLATALILLVTGCAGRDFFSRQPTRVAYEVGKEVEAARPEFEAFWSWYLNAIDPLAPTAEIEVCLTISPAGNVVDSYIDSSTIRRKEFVVGVLNIYNTMHFAARDVSEFTLCDEPLVFYSTAQKHSDLEARRYREQPPPEQEVEEPEEAEELSEPALEHETTEEVTPESDATVAPSEDQAAPIDSTPK